MKFSDMPYERVDFEEVKREFEDLEKRLDAAKSGEEQFAVHEDYYRIKGHVETLMTLAEIRHDIDTTDEFYAGEQDFYDANGPVFQNLCVSYQKKLFASPYREYLEKRIGKVAFKNIELAMKSVDPKILDLMKEENQIQTEYNKLLATAQIDWKGEILNLSLMNPYLHNADRGVRKEAWEKFTQFFVKNQEQLDDIYDRLVKNRTKQGEAMGYENYLPLGYARMTRNCYGREDIASFRAQVKNDFVPFVEKLHERRRQRLGLDHLSYIDEGVYFTNGNPAPIGTPEEILRAGRQMYNELSPETAEFMNFMCDNDLFDVIGRKTKKTGGYMTYLPDYRAPFIFANFNGTSGDADVITHECGHAFQGYVVAGDPIREHADITMETAETHSMSMEFFTEPWMNLLFGDRAKDYVDMHFEDSIMFIPYGTMVDEFQDIAYRNPGLSPAQRNGVWRDLERQYKPHLDYTGNDYYEKGGFWQKQHHIYDCPLYYIDYCIAQTNALQYKVWMDQDYKAAWASYLKLCRLSASDFFDGLVKEVGLNNPFEDGSLAYVAKQLEKKLER
ncbi:oligoendopeptidase, M3 family [Lachnospiraceae bacterium NK3A20]|nr:oligoendopeptidase, M3 family [Lachnospiraceae bacterium NK3A20]